MKKLYLILLGLFGVSGCSDRQPGVLPGTDIVEESDKLTLNLNLKYTLDENRVHSLQDMVYKKILDTPGKFCEILLSEYTPFDLKQALAQYWFQKNYDKILNSAQVLTELSDVTSKLILSNGDIIVGLKDGTILILDSKNGQIKKTFKEDAKSSSNEKAVTALAVLNNGNIIAGLENGNINIWNSCSGKMEELYIESPEFEGPVILISILKNGDIVALFEKTHRLLKWNSNYKLERKLRYEGTVFKVVNDKLISSTKRSIRVMDLNNIQIKEMLNENLGTSIALLPSSGNIAVGVDSLIIKIIDLNTGITMHSLGTVRSYDRHSTPISAIDEMSNQNILTVSNDGLIKIWDIATGRAIRTLTNLAGKSMQAWALRDGDIIADLVYNNGTVLILDSVTGQTKLVLKVIQGSNRVSSIDEMPNGHILAYLSNGKVILWKIPDPIKEFLKYESSRELERGKFAVSDFILCQVDRVINPQS